MRTVFLIVVLVLASAARGETYQYELKGTFKPSSSARDPVSYVLRWSEENGTIRGTYADDFYAKAAPAIGVGGAGGRTVIVQFPEERRGVRTVTVLVSEARDRETATVVPVGVVTRDGRGNPLSTVKGTAQFTTTSLRTVAQLQEENACTEGFGVLAGLCGVYAGLLSEEQDRRNRCNLLFADAVRLELVPDSTVILHLGEVNELISTPGHSIGRLPVNPRKPSIDLMNRVCGPLSGVNSSSTSCKVIHLTGTFSRERQGPRFVGDYTIREEGTNNSCRYRLSMDRIGQEREE
jgi:hypothetical protein